MKNIDYLKKLLIALMLVISCLSIQAAKNVHYTICNVSMHLDPNCESNVVALIPNGTQVSNVVEDCDCEWIPVEYNGNIGYVQSRYLTKNNKQINKKNHKYRKNKKFNRRRNVKKHHYRGSNRYTYRHAVPTSHVGYYTNTSGHTVQRPTRYKGRPAGATALCRDGTYSFSRSARGTCSRHGGVARWL